METADVDRLVMKPTARKRLGKYVLLGRLGHGGMGKIYLAYAPGPAGIEKLLVVKRLHSHLTGDPVLVSSFLDEARLSMALNHPNIVHTYDVGEVDGRTFMVMEYIDGQNLGVVLRTAKRSGRYPSSALWAGLFLSVLDGLHAAHQAKDARGRPLHIIHRDVSPQNVLLTYEGTPKLVDFGIAKAALRITETDAGILKGKYAYMSPEQVRGEPLDARSDVFAAGIVLWEMLAGRRLYKADSIVRSVERILGEAPQSPQKANPDCDADIARVCAKALQKNREHRFASALEFKDALDDALRVSKVRFRGSDLRELMQGLFADVIDRQRAVLEACLNEPALGGDDEDDDVARGLAGGGDEAGSDSESDLKMPGFEREGSDSAASPLSQPLQSHPKVTPKEAGEFTTPSLSRSPLVTDEAEKSRPPQTSIERRRRSSGPSAPQASRPVDDASAGAVVVPLGSPPPLLSVSAESSALRTPTSVPLPAPTQASVPSPPPPKSRRPLVAAVLVLLVGAGAGALVVMGLQERQKPIVVNKAPPAPGVPSVALAAVDAPIDEVIPPPLPQPPVEPPATAPAAVDVADADAADAAAADADAPPDALPDAPADVSQTARREPAKSARPPAKKVERRPERTERPERAEAPPPPDAAVVETGLLTLDTVPWTIVYLGKKKLGETPLVNVPVPAGELELVLVNSGAGVREPYIAKVKAGQTYRARLDLQ